MSQSLEQVREVVLALPIADRLALLQDVRESLVPEADRLETEPELHPAWLEELHRRSEDLESGRVQEISWEDIQKEWEQERT